MNSCPHKLRQVFFKDEDVPSYSINPCAVVICSSRSTHESTSCQITGAQEHPFTYTLLQSNDALGMLAHCQKPKATDQTGLLLE